MVKTNAAHLLVEVFWAVGVIGGGEGTKKEVPERAVEKACLVVACPKSGPDTT